MFALFDSKTINFQIQTNEQNVFLKLNLIDSEKFLSSFDCFVLATTERDITAIMPGVISFSVVAFRYFYKCFFDADTECREKRTVEAAFGMTRGTEAPGLARKHNKSFRHAIRTSDPRKSTLWIASVKVLVHHFLNNRSPVAKVSFKPIIIFKKKWLKIMEKEAVKNGAFRMTWAKDPAHGRDSDSRNVPGR